MIKFFRNIRQKMLTANKFSKYLLYAIGEIVLEVIGILIALQINNWNESRKESNYEQKFLHELKSKLKAENFRFPAYGISCRKPGRYGRQVSFITEA